MDQSTGPAPMPPPRNFLRRWLLTVLWPALGCGGLAAILIGDDPRLEDAGVIYLLGLPAVYWFLTGLLQGRLLGGLVERPWAWTIATWGGGCLALIGGIVTFGGLTFLIAATTRAGYDYAHPLALVPFGTSGAIAGAILGSIQAVSLRVCRRGRPSWIAASTGAGAAAFLVQWLGVNAATFMSGWGRFELTHISFIATIAISLFAGTLLHNLLTGYALQQLWRQSRRYL